MTKRIPKSRRRKRSLHLEQLDQRQLLAAVSVDHVIAISVDGLRPDAVTTLGPDRAPNFYRLRAEGAFTDNARTDHDVTLTNPNHTSMFTGRHVSGESGHSVDFNTDLGTTVHDEAGEYVSSVFDQVHDNGLSTALYASKEKFSIFDRSWDGTNGDVDTIGPDNGRDKIDQYVFNSDTTQLVDDFLTDLETSPANFSFLHLRDPDSAGHGFAWMSSTYLTSVIGVDGLVGQVLDAIAENETLKDNTAVILTSDHGGAATHHADIFSSEIFTIPFYTWGPNIPAVDLYDLNSSSRSDPGFERVAIDATDQPIRNSDIANLAVDFLDLDAISSSVINVLQDLETGDLTPWVNDIHNLDVNGDGIIAPIDALIIINRLNTQGIGLLAVPPAREDYPLEQLVDTTGDNQLAPLDALLVINHLNQNGITNVT